MKNLINCPFDEMMIYSKNLEVPRNAYQRELNPNRVRKIAAEFDEHIANDPKVSFRDGHYYVFDGQHTHCCQEAPQRRSGFAHSLQSVLWPLRTG